MAPEDCLAQVSGSCVVEGMKGGRIEITRDRFGIPHIKATNAFDVYFGQGE
jgi:acyl-homoserine lactone acylase PvdQ